MHMADIEVVKDIPGYKVILKAVLRSQIQQLVEQLATHTDEESVILTANVSDGTLCHLGTESGKVFLEDHEDVKSQFLGFCLKRHHNKQSETDKEPVPSLSGSFSRPSPQSHYNQPIQRFSPKFTHSRPHGPHPVTLTRAPSIRHEPYARNRAIRKPLDKSPQAAKSVVSDPIKMPITNEIVKIEPSDTSESGGSAQALDTAQTNLPLTSRGSSSPAQTSSIDKSETFDKDDIALASDDILTDAADRSNENQSDLNAPGSVSPAGLDVSGVPGTSADPDASNSGEYDPNISVKSEAMLAEPDFDLEITGVQPGSAGSQDAWGPEGMGYDPTGATGNQSDLQGEQGYKKMDDSYNDEGLDEMFDEEATDQTSFLCDKCSYSTKRKFNLKRHRRRHEDPAYTTLSESIASSSNNFLCTNCGKTFKSKPGLEDHFKSVHQKTYKYTCDTCNKGYNGLWNYKGHLASHDSALEERCDRCNASFRYKMSLQKHQQRCGNKELPKVSCPLCFSEFGSKESLREHTKIIHEHVTYHCKRCGKTFKWRSGLAYHLKKCKGTEVPLWSSQSSS